MSFYLFDAVTGLFLSGIQAPKAYTLTKHKPKAISFNTISAVQDYVEQHNLPIDFKVKHDSE